MEAQVWHMTDNLDYNLLDEWLFWFDPEDYLWKASLREDFIKKVKKSDFVFHVIAATSMAQLISHICNTNQEIN